MCFDTRLLHLSSAIVLVMALLLNGCAGSIDSDAHTENQLQWEAEAMAGDRDAQFKLGSFYCCGAGQSRNADLAVAWLCRAAIQGHVEAQFELAKIYVDRFRPKSRSTQNSSVAASAADPDALAKAYVWHTVAAGQGHSDAFEDRQRIGKMRRRGVCELFVWSMICFCVLFLSMIFFDQVKPGP